MLISMAVACAAVAAVAAAVMVWQKFQKHSHCEQALVLLYGFRHACATPLHVLRQISEHMALEMQAGLDQPGGSQLMMLPTFIEHLPNGYQIRSILCPRETLSFVCCETSWLDSFCCDALGSGVRRGCFMRWISAAPIFEYCVVSLAVQKHAW